MVLLLYCITGTWKNLLCFKQTTRGELPLWSEQSALTSSITWLSLCPQRWRTLCQLFSFLNHGVTKLTYSVSHSQVFFQFNHKGDVRKTNHTVRKWDPISVKWNYFRSCPSLLCTDYTYPIMKVGLKMRHENHRKWLSKQKIFHWNHTVENCFYSVILYHSKKKKKWGEMEDYLSVFSNKTLHFIQEEKIWKLGNFCYSFSGYWVKQNNKEKLVLLWGSLTWFSSGPCSLVSWASAELIHAVSQKHL